MRIAAVALGVAAVVSVAIGWLQNPDHITASEAVTAAQHAVDASGLTGAKVDRNPKAGVFTEAKGRRTPVWKTTAEVKDGTIELWLARSDGASVFLDDRSEDGTARLLTDPEFRRLEAHYENPAVPRQLRRNVFLTLAAALIVGHAVWRYLRGDELDQHDIPVTAAPLPDPEPPTRPRRARPLQAA